MKEKARKEIQTYNNLDIAIQSRTAFIYKKTNCLSHEAIPLNNLFGVIGDIGDSSLSKSYIPNELISYVDLSNETPRGIYNKDNNIAYYSPFQGDTPENVLVIIRLFNNLPSIRITIYTVPQIHNQIHGFANENITFQIYNKPNDVLIKANLVITHGYSARKFIGQKVPTMIIGVNGLGGWVTPDNVNYFLKDNFRGRLGGSFNEHIPSQIVVDELLEIKEAENLNNILSENALILDEYLNSFSPKSIDTVISSVTSVYKKLMNESDRGSLIPKLASNVALVNNADQMILINRTIINDVLFSIPQNEKEFLDHLQEGVLTCKELWDKYDISENDFWDTIKSLWERKAIILL